MTYDRDEKVCSNESGIVNQQRVKAKSWEKQEIHEMIYWFLERRIYRSAPTSSVLESVYIVFNIDNQPLIAMDAERTDC